MTEAWPPDYTAEYVRRMGIIARLTNDPVMRAACMAHYANSCEDWINDWGITFDPRIKSGSKIIPFIMFRRQREFIQFLQELLRDKESGLVEKSRDMGATWLCCMFSIWLWLFHAGSSIGWGSRDQDTVDKRGDPDSIFEKMRYQLDALPEWMLPARFDEKFMNISNHDNKSSIKGDAGDNIGRGGRSMIYFKDESAHYERPELIEAALGDNTDVQVDISSVNGTANVFYRRRMAGEIWMPGAKIDHGKTRVFILDWRDHPGKTQEWYDARRRKHEAEGLLHLLAQEVDRDYAAAVSGAIIPAAWVNSAVDAHIRLGFGMDGEKVAALDVADEGADKNAVAVAHGVVLVHADFWGDRDAGIAARRAYGIARDWGCNELDYDCIGVGVGAKVEFNRMREEGGIPDSFIILPWNAAESPENPDQRIIPEDPNSPTIGDYYLNRKSQGWGSLRQRFEKTHRAVTEGVYFDPAELISLSSKIPCLHQLKLELSQPVWTPNGKGKMQVDKKPDGAISPNVADAVMMRYLPMRSAEGGLGFLEFLRRESPASSPH